MERREFLTLLGQAGLYTAALKAPLLLPRAASAAAGFQAIDGVTVKPAKAKAVVLIWLAGGMAHTETFDPKPVVPFSKGLDSRMVLSTFPAIPTSVDGLQISKGLENIAQVMDRAALIRTVQGPDLGPVLHTRHQYHWHTGYVPPLTVLAPHMGAWITQTLGPRNDYAPPFVEIGQGFSFTGAEEVRAYFTGGFLGSEYGPLHIERPTEATKRLTPPKKLGREGLQKRLELHKEAVESSGREMSDYHQQSLLRSMMRTQKLLFSPALNAFQIDQEPKDSYDAYNTGDFGLGCLLARRLVEAGSRFVEVTSEYVPFGTWDTHKNGHTRTKVLKQLVDRPIAKLVLDLEERGLLDETLVVVASEFSRVAGRNPGQQQKKEGNLYLTQPSHYGLHRHFIGAGSVVLFGGGVKGGTVYGETAPEFPCDAVKDPVTVSQVHATIYQLLGIPPDFGYEVEDRPFYVTKDAKGTTISPVIA
ncbi:MAG: DUF1501 domain-containing protein [Bdellovibrionales bacterium]|nr:DUF1501 domain-containing protein [Bdellovibrionales bacterium]